MESVQKVPQKDALEKQGERFVCLLISTAIKLTLPSNGKKPEGPLVRDVKNTIEPIVAGLSTCVKMIFP
jgi:hypothetical protein